LRKFITVVVAALLSGAIALTGSLYECYPTEPDPGETAVCPMEGLEPAYSGEFGWFIHDPHEPWAIHELTMTAHELTMIWDQPQPKVVWHAAPVVGPLPDRATLLARLVEFSDRLLDELRDGFGKIDPGEVDIEKNESLKRLVDEFQEETGLEIVGVEIE
jgi:hypothetical protein